MFSKSKCQQKKYRSGLKLFGRYHCGLLWKLVGINMVECSAYMGIKGQFWACYFGLISNLMKLTHHI